MVNPLFSKSKPVVQEEDLSSTEDLPYWRVLIVDDEPEVHNVTVLALKNFKVLGRYIEYSHAYSANEAMELLDENDDFAVAFVDVVMETDHAGLELVDYIRNTLNNSKVRLVLRTGQPGQAPEQSVVEKYDINDYREKTELTSNKLKTVLFSALRSFRDINTIDEQRLGLQNILSSSSNVLKSSQLTHFASAVLQEVKQIISVSDVSVYCISQPIGHGHEKSYLLSADNEGNKYLESDDLSLLPENVSVRIQSVLTEKKNQTFDDAYILYQHSEIGFENIIYVCFSEKLSAVEYDFLQLYIANVSLIFDGLIKSEDNLDSQKELVYMLSEAVEQRSLETGMHVKRVAILSELLAQLNGMSLAQCELMKHASPLHDFGKIAIPDHILHKPGKLDAQEWEIMMTHASKGEVILGNSGRPIFDTASLIAGSHHEKWNGSGYPRKLKGQDIPIEGRIVAIVDVFDALGSKRSYKEPWTNDKIKEVMIEGRGEHFDPVLTDILIENFEAFCEVRRQYPDQLEEAL
jgi:response regulator RpfG family c-di-GMP phosphodiesterase